MALFASLLWSHFQKNFGSYREHTYNRRSGLWFSILIGSFLWQAGFCVVLWNQRAFLGWNRPWMRFEIWCSLMSFFWCIWDLAFVDATAGFHAARERGYRGYYIYIRRHSWLYPWSNHWSTSPKVFSIILKLFHNPQWKTEREYLCHTGLNKGIHYPPFLS